MSVSTASESAKALNENLKRIAEKSRKIADRAQAKADQTIVDLVSNRMKEDTDRSRIIKPSEILQPENRSPILSDRHGNLHSIHQIPKSGCRKCHGRGILGYSNNRPVSCTCIMKRR